MGEALTAGRDTPGFNWYWAQRRNFFTEEFQQYVDSLKEKSSEAAVIYE